MNEAVPLSQVKLGTLTEHTPSYPTSQGRAMSQAGHVHDNLPSELALCRRIDLGSGWQTSRHRPFDV